MAARRTKLFLAAALVLVVVAVVAAVVWQRARPREVRPPRTADVVARAARTSTLTVPLVVPLADLQARLDKSVPTTLHTIDEDVDDCVGTGVRRRLGLRMPKIGCRLRGEVTRGAIAISGEGDVLRLAMPVTIQVAARGKGDIASLVGETATGRMTVRAAARADVNADWEPSLHVATDVEWDQRIGVDVLGVRIPLGAAADAAIERAVRAIEKEAPRHLRALDMKARAEEGWRRAHVVVALGRAPDAWLRFVPRSVGFGGYRIRDDELRATIRITGNAETVVGKKPSPPAATRLPPLQRSADGSGFSFDLPVSLPYPALEQLAEQELHVGKHRAVDVAGIGAVDVVVRDVTMFQTTGHALAVGVDVAVTPPGTGDLLAAEGTVWLTTHLTVDAAHTRIEPARLVVVGHSKSLPVDLALSALQLEAVNVALRDALAVDYARASKQAIAQANAELHARTLAPGVVLDAKVTKVTPTTIVAGPHGIEAALVVDGTATVTIAVAR